MSSRQAKPQELLTPLELEILQHLPGSAKDLGSWLEKDRTTVYSALSRKLTRLGLVFKVGYTWYRKPEPVVNSEEEWKNRASSILVHLQSTLLPQIEDLTRELQSDMTGPLSKEKAIELGNLWKDCRDLSSRAEQIVFYTMWSYYND